ncbi:MAG: nuclear transport factor 2 family protein [Acidimicrobiia bacterium]
MADGAALQVALDEIVTKAALRNLAERYAQGVDRRDRDTFLSAFHPDATLAVHHPSEKEEGVNVMQGHDQIGEVPEFIKVYPKTYHVLGQSTYELDGDTATGETYCVAHHLTPDRHGGTNYVMYIRYADTYRREAGEWRIATRRVNVDWTDQRAANPEGR